MGRLRVLLVDDHEEFRTSAARLLAIEGLNVVATASSGDAAVAALDEFDVDLVLLDLLMPGRDGVDVARELAGRADPPAVILISSQADSGLDPRVRDAPVVGFLSKRDLSCSSVLALVG